MFNASSISASEGSITGMILFTNEFVIVDDLPVILTGLGILNAFFIRLNP
jgi:hypothetical protein